MPRAGGSSGGGGGGRSGGGSGGHRSSSSSSRSRSSPSPSRSSISRNNSRTTSYNTHNHTYSNSPQYQRHGSYSGSGYRSSSGSPWIGLVAFAVIAIVAILIITNFDNQVTKSTIERTPLPKSSVVETSYYSDTIGDWISNSTKLTAGMKNFYNKTGVQPYLYITNNIDGKHGLSYTEVEPWLQETYKDLFKDEAHLLFVFYEYNDKYDMYYWVGSQAKSVLDNEAMDILMDYVELYYYTDKTEDELFSTAFDAAATRIMDKQTNPLIPLIVGAVVIGILIITSFTILRLRRIKKEQAAIDLEILNAPIRDLPPQDIE